MYQFAVESCVCQSRGTVPEVGMPIFEYICKGCGKKFEAIVYGSKQSECPACKGTELEQQLSTFAAHGTDKSSGAAPKLPCGMSPGSCGGGGCGMN